MIRDRASFIISSKEIPCSYRSLEGQQYEFSIPSLTQHSSNLASYFIFVTYLITVQTVLTPFINVRHCFSAVFLST